MNVFIYDDFIKKHQKNINNIEILLHNLNLNGKIIYLESIKNINDLIKDEINNGAKTLIAVGNNKTLNKVLNAVLAKKDKPDNITIGIIPIGNNNSIAQACGIKNEKEACQAILARRIEKINTPKINDLYFLSSIKTKAQESDLKIKDFIINPINKGEINIINLPTTKSSSRNIFPDPQDNQLNLFIDNNGKKTSHLLINEVEINNLKDEKVEIDESILIQTPVKISINQEKINLIVGKNRIFNI